MGHTHSCFRFQAGTWMSVPSPIYMHTQCSCYPFSHLGSRQSQQHRLATTSLGPGCATRLFPPARVERKRASVQGQATELRKRGI